MNSRIASACLIVLTALTTASAEDWPQWRGPQRDGKVAADASYTADMQCEELWSAEVGTGFSSLVVAERHLLTSGNIDNQDIIWCLNAADGTEQWRFTYEAPLDPNLFEGGPTATPTIADGSVYCISRTGEIFCLNLADGTINWHVKIPESERGNVPSWGFSSSPLVLDKRVYFNVGSHGLCLNAENGDIVWESPADQLPGYTSALLMNTPAGRCLLLESEKTLNAINPDDGTVLWSHPWITRYGINAADPLILSEKQLLLTSGYGKGAALLELNTSGEQTTVNEVWRSRQLKDQLSPGVLLDGKVYAVDGDAGRSLRLVCLEPETGHVLWQHSGFGSASLIARGRQLLLLAETGELVIIDANPKQLSIVARFPILSGKCWTPPAFADSKLFARNAAGKVVCVELK